MTTYRTDLLAALDARVAFESSKNSVDNMFRTLADLRKSVDHDAVANAMSAANVDVNFINRSERANARFNVYAAEKVVNVARASIAAAQLNHYTKCILASVKNLHANNMLLTHEDAVAACSRAIKVRNAAKKKHIVQYAKDIAPNTATTQSSSSINALQMYSVLIETRDESNTVAYRLNTESEIANKLLALV